MSRFKHLVLCKPLAFLDLETTGIDPKTDRVIEISILKVFPDGRSDHQCRRVNPGIPIPPQATAVHGVSSADVANEPIFSQLAASLLAFLDGCDLCGFNLKRFDLRVLYAEFTRAQMTLSLEGRALLDPMEVFHAREPRDLTAAVRFYRGREHENAHSASSDVFATVEVLDAMLGHYADLPRTVDGLFEHFKSLNAVDANGYFVRAEGVIQFTFGKHRGQRLDVVARLNRDYLEWMLTSDFPDDTKAIVKAALRRSRSPATV